MIIGGIEVGDGCAPFVVADLSANHLGSFDRAVDLIYKARFAGVDAVKLQIYDPDRLAARRGGKDKVVAEAPWAGRTLGDLFREAYTPREWFSELSVFHSCLFASVFDVQDVEYLEACDCIAYKIASREAPDWELVSKAASTGKPLIISTGTATQEELGRSIAEAVKRNNQVGLLYCISEYPTPLDHIDFSQIGALRYRYQLPVGFSDHTLGVEAAVKAVESGACIIEKHITLSRADGGPDAAFSLEPAEFAKLVADVKDAYASLGTGERPASEAPYRELRRHGA